MIDDILFFEEGYSEYVYYDTLKFPTIGIGQRIGPQNAPLEFYTFNVPIDLAKTWVNYKVESIELSLSSNVETFKAWNNCNQPRRDILTSMCYQFGFEGFCEFDNMIQSLNKKDFDKAAEDALDSLWHKQTENRAERHAEVIKDGDYSAYEGLL